MWLAAAMLDSIYLEYRARVSTFFSVKGQALQTIWSLSPLL